MRLRRGSRSSGQKRIHHHYAIIVLAVIEVFGEELLAAGGFGGGEDGGVPVGGLEAFFEAERGLEDGNGVVLDAEALPFLDEADGEIVRQGIAAAWVGGLYVELLEHLDGEGDVAVDQDFTRDCCLCWVGRLQVERVDEDVGINEAHRGHGVRPW